MCTTVCLCAIVSGFMTNIASYAAFCFGASAGGSGGKGIKTIRCFFVTGRHTTDRFYCRATITCVTIRSAHWKHICICKCGEPLSYNIFV